MREMKQTALRGVRESANMSKAEVSRRSKVQATMIGWIEEGRFIPYPAQLKKIARAIKYEGDMYDLLEEV